MIDFRELRDSHSAASIDCQREDHTCIVCCRLCVGRRTDNRAIVALVEEDVRTIAVEAAICAFCNGQCQRIGRLERAGTISTEE